MEHSKLSTIPGNLRKIGWLISWTQNFSEFPLLKTSKNVRTNDFKQRTKLFLVRQTLYEKWSLNPTQKMAVDLTFYRSMTLKINRNYRSSYREVHLDEKCTYIACEHMTYQNFSWSEWIIECTIIPV